MIASHESLANVGAAMICVFPPSCGARAWVRISAILAVLATAAAGCRQAGRSGEWQNLFDGKTLAGWKQSGFEGETEVKVLNPFRGGPGAIVLEAGTTLSGITWIDGSALPRMNYEISLEAMKLEGEDFFCGLTFPVGPAACTFIMGGWGGTVVGISSIDREDASGNETTSHMEFAHDRWYRIHLRVTDQKIEAWIDGEQKVDFAWKGHRIALRPGDIQQSLPLGIASYMTRAALRNVRLRRL